jgi:hypothetical protein
VANGWATNSCLLRIKIPIISVSVYATDIAETPEIPVTDVNIAEVITYRVLVTMPEVLSAASIDVTLPAGIIYRNASVVYVGSTIQNSQLTAGQLVSSVSSQLVTFTFGTVNLIPDNVVNNEDTFLVEVIAQVMDVVGNVDTTILTTSSDIANDLITVSDTVPVTVVEPDLVSLAVVVSPALPALSDAGDVVSFSSYLCSLSLVV